MRKQGSKNLWRIERKLRQNGIKIGAINRQDFEKYKKNCIPKTVRKTDAERNHPKLALVSDPCRPGFENGAGSILGFNFDSRSFSLNLTRPAPGGRGGCFFIQNGDMGFPGSSYLFIFDVLG